MQEVVLLIEPSEKAYRTPSKIGYLFMNRFAIDEDAGFEIRKVAKFWSTSFRPSELIGTERKEKGMVLFSGEVMIQSHATFGIDSYERETFLSDKNPRKK